MNYENLISSGRIEKRYLDEKKQQTDYKIKYISKYIEKWLIVQTNRPIEAVSFIDCMCNAGIYADGDLGTPMLVLNAFIESAQAHPEIDYQLVLNDYDEKRIEIIQIVAEELMEKGGRPGNVKVSYFKSDVNVFLCNYKVLDPIVKRYGGCVLFVDPYDFGTVVINNLSEFAKRYYCEIIFNLFTSDFVRNKIDDRIRRCVDNYDIKNISDLIGYINCKLRVGHQKHVFSYRFDTIKNVELYQIVYTTPHLKGLALLKETLWDVFDGKFKHRNYKTNDEQLSLFSVDEEKSNLISFYGKDAQEKLLDIFNGQTIDYQQIENYLMENTMLKDGQFIKHVIRPLVENGKIIKLNIVSNKNNYKDDKYRI